MKARVAWAIIFFTAAGSRASHVNTSEPVNCNHTAANRIASFQLVRVFVNSNEPPSLTVIPKDAVELQGHGDPRSAN
jgi:hypothetical protein